MLSSRLSLSILFLALFAACTDFDDQALPTDAQGQIYFQEFELNADRGYVLTKLINDSPYTLTSCRFRIKIYPQNSTSELPLKLSEVSSDDFRTSGSAPGLTEDFFIRETLEPGYSTEVYYELQLKGLGGLAVFTKELVSLKGRAATPLH
ncbi:MAG: hypothetical protein L3J79_00880 [Candidatus Marinimicrobia bacterium]|nr:hypothetical protein [Candidatus Neomarinimicrobiota bacterium]